MPWRRKSASVVRGVTVAVSLLPLTVTVTGAGRWASRTGGLRHSGTGAGLAERAGDQPGAGPPAVLGGSVQVAQHLDAGEGAVRGLVERGVVEGGADQHLLRDGRPGRRRRHPEQHDPGARAPLVRTPV